MAGFRSGLLVGRSTDYAMTDSPGRDTARPLSDSDPAPRPIPVQPLSGPDLVNADPGNPTNRSNAERQANAGLPIRQICRKP